SPTMLPLLRSLFAHAEWANSAVTDSLRRSPGSDPHALKAFAHILAAEHVWLCRLDGRSARVTIWPDMTLGECVALSLENVSGYAQLLDRASDESLATPLTYRNSAGIEYTDRVGDILAHVALHGAYHRGQISLMLRRSGGSPVATDFIAYVRRPPEP
ncbi:MAG: DinB family protein, partial [Gemmatimonadota bacterium]